MAAQVRAQQPLTRCWSSRRAWTAVAAPRLCSAQGLPQAAAACPHAASSPRCAPSSRGRDGAAARCSGDQQDRARLQGRARRAACQASKSSSAGGGKGKGKDVVMEGLKELATFLAPSVAAITASVQTSLDVDAPPGSSATRSSRADRPASTSSSTSSSSGGSSGGSLADWRSPVYALLLLNAAVLLLPHAGGALLLRLGCWPAASCTRTGRTWPRPASSSTPLGGCWSARTAPGHCGAPTSCPCSVSAGVRRRRACDHVRTAPRLVRQARVRDWLRRASPQAPTPWCCGWSRPRARARPAWPCRRRRPAPGGSLWRAWRGRARGASRSRCWRWRPLWCPPRAPGARA